MLVTVVPLTISGFFDYESNLLFLPRSYLNLVRVYALNKKWKRIQTSTGIERQQKFGRSWKEIKNRTWHKKKKETSKEPLIWKHRGDRRGKRGCFEGKGDGD